MASVGRRVGECGQAGAVGFKGVIGAETALSWMRMPSIEVLAQVKGSVIAIASEDIRLVLPA